ncbi:TetR/AcrR family transcriptional regulator [Rhodococcus sp. BP-241]|uniref:TetR/AcrR family transcriptional regulator n=1 Tax=Rhodococcus sp. BP-241 TaxID=2739441 RepID=UPI001C9BB64D|nr:TetR/AcrR family transcriptional regulator [Rhodococcus sp. BP-241]MBY6708396.1 TetR/AcrR family transcriptional regulator [Rhodococcus sp. BP-241]
MAATSGNVTARTGRTATRSRAQTRERVLDGALEVFVERGFGRSTPEQICERAGFTRGAFYSNFSSMDEVFLELWTRQASGLITRVRGVVDALEYDASDGRSFEQIVVAALSGLVGDVSWHVLMAEFGAHAARNPGLAAVVTGHRAALRDALRPMIVHGLAIHGREVAVDDDTLGRGVVAAYEGAMAQAMIEPANPVPARLALELVAAVIWSFSRER